MSEQPDEQPARDDLPLNADEQVGEEVEPEHDLDLNAFDIEDPEEADQ
jgi:hypothetical protein